MTQISELPEAGTSGSA